MNTFPVLKIVNPVVPHSWKKLFLTNIWSCHISKIQNEKTENRELPWYHRPSLVAPKVVAVTTTGDDKVGIMTALGFQSEGVATPVWSTAPESSRFTEVVSFLLLRNQQGTANKLSVSLSTHHFVLPGKSLSCKIVLPMCRYGWSTQRVLHWYWLPGWVALFWDSVVSMSLLRYASSSTRIQGEPNAGAFLPEIAHLAM